MTDAPNLTDLIGAWHQSNQQRGMTIAQARQDVIKWRDQISAHTQQRTLEVIADTIVNLATPILDRDSLAKLIRDVSVEGSKK